MCIINLQPAIVASLLYKEANQQRYSSVATNTGRCALIPHHLELSLLLANVINFP